MIFQTLRQMLPLLSFKTALMTFLIRKARLYNLIALFLLQFLIIIKGLEISTRLLPWASTNCEFFVKFLKALAHNYGKFFQNLASNPIIIF